MGRLAPRTHEANSCKPKNTRHGVMSSQNTHRSACEVHICTPNPKRAIPKRPTTEVKVLVHCLQPSSASLSGKEQHGKFGGCWSRIADTRRPTFAAFSAAIDLFLRREPAEQARHHFSLLKVSEHYERRAQVLCPIYRYLARPAK